MFATDGSVMPPGLVETVVVCLWDEGGPPNRAAADAVEADDPFTGVRRRRLGSAVRVATVGAGRVFPGAAEREWWRNDVAGADSAVCATDGSVMPPGLVETVVVCLRDEGGPPISV